MDLPDHVGKAMQSEMARYVIAAHSWACKVARSEHTGKPLSNRDKLKYEIFKNSNPSKLGFAANGAQIYNLSKDRPVFLKFSIESREGNL